MMDEAVDDDGCLEMKKKVGLMKSLEPVENILLIKDSERQKNVYAIKVRRERD